MRIASLVTVAALFAAAGLTGCDGAGKPGGSDLAAAKKHLQERNKSSAIIVLKETLRKNPDAVEARFLLGKALLESAEPGQALVELRKALELGHPESAAVPQIVKALSASGRAEEAIKTYADKTFDDKPSMAELQTGLAAAYGLLGQTAKMRSLVDTALATDPSNAAALTMKAMFTAQEGKADESMALLERVLNKDPGYPSALYVKGLLLRHFKKDTDGAIAAQRAALRSEPTMTVVHSELLSIYYASQDKAAMRAQIVQMQRAMPKSLATALFKAQVEFVDNNLRAARDLVQQLLRAKEPDYRVLMLAAEIEARSGALTLAETYLTRALNNQPRLDIARPMLAQIQVRLGQTDKALRTIQPLLESPAPPAAAFAVAAEAYLHSGNPAKAQGYFENALKANPDDPRLQTAAALNRMARGQLSEGLLDLEKVASSSKETFADLALISTLLRRAQFDPALKAIDRLMEKDRTGALPIFLRGQTLWAKGDAAGARSSYVQALQRDPVHFPSAKALGALDLSANDLPAAKRHFEAMLVKDPGNYRAMLALADLKQRNREPRGEVLALLNDAVKRNPGELEARLALIEFNLAGRAHKAALSAAQEALAATPDNPALLDALARAQVGNREYQQAINTYRRLAILLPKSALPHLRIADVHVARAEKSAAAASLQRALEIAPDLVDAQIRQVDLLIEERRHKEALAIARRLQQKQPKASTGYTLEAAVHVDQKAWDAAAGVLRESLSRQPTTAGAMRMHQVLHNQGKGKDAERFASDWLAKHPKDLVFLFHLASAAGREQDWPQAERYYREVLTINPEHVTSNNNLAWALMNQRKPGALPFAQRANQASPGVAGVMDTLAAALADAGQVKDALELQKKVVAMAPALLEARLTLARIAIQAGDKSLARSELERLAYEGNKFPQQEAVATLLRDLK